jgi:hypothetical protein
LTGISDYLARKGIGEARLTPAVDRSRAQSQASNPAIGPIDQYFATM